MDGKIYTFLILFLISANIYGSRITARVKREGLFGAPSFPQVRWQYAKNNAPPASSYHFNKDQLIVSEPDDGNTTVILWNKEESLSSCQQHKMRFLVPNKDVILYWDKVQQTKPLPAKAIHVRTSSDQETNTYVGKHAGRVGSIELTKDDQYDFVFWAAPNKTIFETPNCDFEVLCANKPKKAGVVINSWYRGK